MKHFLCPIFILFLLSGIQFQVRSQSYNISETINSDSYKISGTIGSIPTSFREIVIVAIDSCDYSSSTLPTWFTNNYTKVHDFFNAATFGNFNYEIHWLTKDATHAYIMPRVFIPYGAGCEHVHSQANILAVLSQVDAQVNFADYDYDNTGIVSVHFTSINILGTHNGGVTNCSYTYTTNDYNSNGQRIVVHVDRQSRGMNQNAYFVVFNHESGHSLFNFPDMDHSNNDDFNHYGIGGFDVMCGGGFQSVPSLYNPWFRHSRSWFTPTSISSDATLTLQDFQTSGQCYLYTPSSLPSNSISNEKYYISYHKPTNQFYAAWPYKDPSLGGVIIWHVKKTSPSIYDDYSDYRTMDIAIKAAHGKYVWSESSSAVTNTGVENALTGRDSLQIRKIALNSSSYYNEIQGPYYGKDKGSSSIFYTPSDGKNFTFYTNPNSNWYVNSSSENYGQSIVSGFSMKNLRQEGGAIKADFSTNDYAITTNSTFAVGKWYFNNSITVQSGVTLTIQPGTQLIFNNGASLIVNGELIAIGTSSLPITFTSTTGTTGSWGSILLNSSGANNSTLSYANIQYGTEVDIENASNVTISHCNISNCSGTGIYFYGSTGSAMYNTIACSNNNNGIYVLNGSTVNCQYNTIYNSNHNQQGYGIFYSGSSGTVGENDVDYFNYGISSYWASSIVADQNPITFNNRVTNCNYGLVIDWQSSCNFGVSTSGSSWGLNSIYNNRIYNAAVGYNFPNLVSTLYAQCDWWGSNPPNSSLFYVGTACNGYFNYPLSVDPWSGRPLPSIRPISNKDGVKAGEIVASVIKNNNQGVKLVSGETAAGQSSITDSLLAGVEMLGQHKNKEAKNFFMSYLKSHPNNRTAYIELYASADSETTPDIIQYFTSLPAQVAKEHRLLLSYLYLKQGNPASAKSVNNAIISDIPNTFEATKAKLNNFYIALYNNNDPGVASAILKDVENSTSLLILTEISEAEHALTFYVNPQTGIMPKLSVGQSANNSTMLTSLPTQSELMANYPNPFNPTTIIVYQLPKDGFVSLKVYDILGREVKTLVNGYRTVGKYSVSFDGSNLASGIYFYQLRVNAGGTNNFVSTKKMQLLK